MMEIKNAVLKVRRQKREELEMVLEKCVSLGEGTEYLFQEADGVSGRLIVEAIPGGQVGRLALTLSNTAFDENTNLRMETPATLELEVTETPEKITAMYLFSDWWTRPAFEEDFSQIPQRTQAAFLKYPDRYACLLPGAGEAYKTYLAPGGRAVISLELTAYMGGMNSLDEPVFYLAEDCNLYQAIGKAFAGLAAVWGVPKRAARRLPEMFRYLGWCSWDAFYKEVDEEKLREKARELREKQVPVRWIMIDDGWLSVEGDLLYDFVPEKKKFPKGFAELTAEIRGQGTVSWFGVWHALAGYWGGVLPGSPLAQKEQAHLCHAANGKLLPAPRAEAAFGFYRDWYELLRKEGINFVKVDAQSAVKNYYENMAPVCHAAREIHEGLEGAVSYFGGAIINCMGMAMESMLARPSSAISRSSDDFCPGKVQGFAEHLLQNAYNTLYQDELYYCDWDMFWTDHKDSVKHSLLRGISGGPVYFSDKIGETIPEVLKPIAYLDGEILMMDRGVKPSADCVFSDPMKDGVLKLTNVAPHGQAQKGGGIAAYNLTRQRQAYWFSPSDIYDLSDAGQYWVYDYFNRTACLCGKNDQIRAELEADDYAWHQILVCDGDGTFLGLVEKYVGFLAVESMYVTENGMGAQIKEQGAIGFLSLRKLAAVRCNGTDVLGKVEKKGWLYILHLEENRGKVAIEVAWE